MSDRWPEYGKEALERAVREQKPLLIHFDSLSRHSSRLAKSMLESPALREVLARFIPVRVGFEERPDLVGRLVAADGACLAAARADGSCAAFFSQEESAALSSALLEFARSYRSSGESAAAAPGPVWSGAVGEKRPPPEAPESWPSSVLAEVKAQPAGAIPCPDCLELLLFAASEARDNGAKDLVLARLDLMARGNFWDREAGGFSSPDSEKTLPLNARMARLYWDAYALTGRDFFREIGLRALDFIVADLYAAPGAFIHCRRDHDAKRYYADANAMVALALTRASGFPEGAKYGETAQRLLEMLTQWFDAERGMAHVWDGERAASVWGLLNDGAWAILALTESFLSGGPAAHRDFADRILRHLFQNLWERDLGGFLDRPAGSDDFGPLKKPLIPVAGNAAAFEAAWRLHQLKGNSHYQQWAEQGLRALIGRNGARGCAAAPLARVLDLFRRGRLDFELVGRPGERRTTELLAALNRHYLPRKIVSFISPDDQDYILAHRLDAAQLPALFACVNLRPTAKALQPEEVPGLIKRP